MFETDQTVWTPVTCRWMDRLTWQNNWCFF